MVGIVDWLIDWSLMLNTTFSNISAVSMRPVLVVKEAIVLWENHRPWASNLYPISACNSRQLYWKWINNYLSIEKKNVYPKYKLHTNFIRNWTRLRQATWRMYQWIHIPMVKRGWYICTHQKLIFIPISKLIQINIILSDNVHISYIYNDTCLNQTLNKPEYCINLTLNQDSM